MSTKWWIMEGREQAAGFAAVLFILALMTIPILGLLSAAGLGLVALKQGWREALLTSLLAGFLVAGLVVIILDSSALLPVLLSAFLLWLPLILVALFLRWSMALSWTIQLCILLGMLVIGLQYIFIEDTALFWQQQLQKYTQFIEPRILNPLQWQNMVEQMAAWMPGAIGTAFFLQLVLSLFIARFWHAQIDHPGGFRQEIERLRLSPYLSGGLLLLFLLALFMPDQIIFSQLALVIISAFFIQGIGIAHTLMVWKKLSIGWFIAFYFLLFVSMPHSFILLSAIGFSDPWLDLRSRVKAKDADGPSQ